MKTVHLLRLLRLVQKMEHYSQHSSLVLALLMTIFTLLAHWTACVWYLVGLHDLKTSELHHVALIYAMIFGNMTAIIQRMYARHSLYHTRMQDLNSFIRSTDIPEDLKQRMLDSFQTACAGNSSTNNKLLGLNSDNLRVDINMHLYKELLGLALFGECSVGCLWALSKHIRSACVRDEILIHRNEGLHTALC